jgi:hypothetical protein
VRRAGPFAWGAAAVAAYLLAVTVTVAIRHDDARPLYDGFTAPTSYRFVEPPAFFSSGNVEPHDLTTTIPLTADGSAAAGFATSDGQFVVNLGRGAIAAVPGATTVAVHVTPLAPRRLTAVPDGLRANGNAYRVDMTYEPTGGAVTRFVHPGTMLIEIPELGTALFTSLDAQSWTPVAARPIPPRQLSMSAQFRAPGYYVGATRLPELASPPGRSHRTAIILGLATTAAALVAFASAYAVVRRRRNAPS